MTQERLNEANQVNKEINKYKSFLKAFDSPYGNSIKATDFEGDKETTQMITLTSEPELEVQVREYIIHKIEVLRQQFANL